MRTMDVNGVWKNCMYREVVSEQELRAVPMEPPEDEEEHDEREAEVLGAVRPLVARVFGQFRDALDVLLRRHPGAPVSEAIGEQVFLSGLARQVLGIIAPTLVVELNVARANGMLHGETVDARFHNFLDDLDDEARATALLRQYPVLAQLLRAVLTARADARLQCLRHLCEDWPAIRECWPLLAETRLAGVAASVGDPRCGGRTTLLLDFQPGLLIYRPRSIAVDVHFQELLEWLNSHGANPAFLTVRMLDRGDHGWVEVVAPVVCASNEASARFHERLGSLIAVLHVLEAADVSSAHVVAHGEHPVLVDVETLFQSQARHRSAGSEPVESRTGGSLVAQGLAQSILRVGLLQRSGPGDAREVAAPGLVASPGDVVSIERGFTRMYRLLCTLRPMLLREDGPIWRFARDRVRVALRPPSMYAALLIKGTSPEVLRDGVERERLFDRLWEDLDGQPELARVIHAERDDLERGDMPCFTSMPGSRSIWTSSGMELQGFYERSALHEVEAHLERLGDDDLERQRWLLRVSLASRSPQDGRPQEGPPSDDSAERWEQVSMAVDADERPKRRVPIGPLMAPPLDPDEYVEAAERVARRLERLAFADGVRAGWIGVVMPHDATIRDSGSVGNIEPTLVRQDETTSDRRWSIEPMGLELGNGLCGVALFLARLASVTGQPRHRLFAEQAAVGVLEALDVRREWTSVGAFAGWGGVIYALAHLGVLLESGDYVDRADALVSLVEELVDRDEALDINAGAAGAIMGLAALHAVKPSDRIVSAIRACGSRLLVRAERLPIGYGWRVPGAVVHSPLLGFPEGASGISLALLTASELTNDPAAHDIGHHAMEYERSAFVPETKNWPDMRAAAGAAVVSTTTWCRGAPGIGLARVAGLRYLDYWRVRAEISDAVKATMRSGFGGSHCLCHGDLGSLEFLAVAAGRLGDVTLRRDVAQIAAGVMRGIDERGWRCGTIGEVETPGYLTGLAGIGDGLLRVAEPRLPSVLMLEAPASPGVRAPRRRRQAPVEGGAVKRVLKEELPVPVVARQP